MKKYEPAGGVVPIKWIRGGPNEEDEYGQIIFEKWTECKSMWNHARPELGMIARIIAAKWDYQNKQWVTLDGSEIPEKGYVRRWARLSTNSARINLKIKDWWQWT